MGASVRSYHPEDGITSISSIRPARNPIPYDNIRKMEKRANKIAKRTQELIMRYELSKGNVPSAFKFYADRGVQQFEPDGYEDKTFNDAIKEVGIIGGPVWRKEGLETKLDAHSLLDSKTGELIAHEKDLEHIAYLREIFEPCVASNGEQGVEFGSVVTRKKGLLARLLESRSGRLGIGIGITVLILGGVYAAASLSGSHPGGGGGGDDNNYQIINGDVRATAYSGHNTTGVIDDKIIIDVTNDQGHHYLFGYGKDNEQFNATYFRELILSQEFGWIKAKADQKFIPPNEDIAWILEDHSLPTPTPDNTYKIEEIIDYGK